MLTFNFALIVRIQRYSATLRLARKGFSAKITGCDLKRNQNKRLINFLTVQVDRKYKFTF